MLFVVLDDLQCRFNDHGDFDGFHAAKIERAFAEEAGAAFDVQYGRIQS
jgi:hypothetical protein